MIVHAEVSLFPNWIGVDQQRIMEFDSERLTLSTPPMVLVGARQSPRLVWERALPGTITLPSHALSLTNLTPVGRTVPPSSTDRGG